MAYRGIRHVSQAAVPEGATILNTVTSGAAVRCAKFVGIDRKAKGASR
jgi:hypothetical protein